MAGFDECRSLFWPEQFYDHSYPTWINLEGNISVSRRYPWVKAHEDVQMLSKQTKFIWLHLFPEMHKNGELCNVINSTHLTPLLIRTLFSLPSLYFAVANRLSGKSQHPPGKARVQPFCPLVPHFLCWHHTHLRHCQSTGKTRPTQLVLTLVKPIYEGSQFSGLCWKSRTKTPVQVRHLLQWHGPLLPRGEEEGEAAECGHTSERCGVPAVPKLHGQHCGRRRFPFQLLPRSLPRVHYLSANLQLLLQLQRHVWGEGERPSQHSDSLPASDLHEQPGRAVWKEVTRRLRASGQPQVCQAQAGAAHGAHWRQRELTHFYQDSASICKRTFSFLSHNTTAGFGKPENEEWVQEHPPFRRRLARAMEAAERGGHWSVLLQERWQAVALQFLRAVLQQPHQEGGQSNKPHLC